jgi:transcription elongation factor Elf1
MATTNGTAMQMVERSKARGFKLSCPSCGEDEVTITLDLSDLATCHCGSCDDEFAVSTAVNQMAERLAKWRAVARWIDLAGECLAAPETERE